MVAAFQPGGAGSSYATAQAPNYNPWTWMNNDGTINVRGMAGDVSNAYQNAWNQAAGTNEQRYTDILGGYRDLYQQQMDLASKNSGQRATDISNQYTAAGNTAQQQLVNSGLGFGASTISPSMQGLFQTQKQYALNNNQDYLTQQQLQYGGQAANNALSFMNSRQDTYPDANQMTSMMNLVGQAGLDQQQQNAAMARIKAQLQSQQQIAAMNAPKAAPGYTSAVASMMPASSFGGMTDATRAYLNSFSGGFSGGGGYGGGSGGGGGMGIGGPMGTIDRSNIFPQSNPYFPPQQQNYQYNQNPYQTNFSQPAMYNSYQTV